MSHWQPLSKDTDWNLSRVVHLHRRAAWGATWPEVTRDLREGPQPSIERLLSPQRDGLHPQTEALADVAASQGTISFLKAAWVNEMWHGSDPLGTQLTLMWHNHFATGFQKVQDCGAMLEQFLTLRKHARGSFRDLVRAIVRDRAMLIWLDGDSNQKGKPNENLARELMELFTVGEGHYSETDVREAARALTGWTTKKGHVRFDSDRHDKGQKRILDHEATFDTDSLTDMLVDHPATSRRIAWRICNQFLGAECVPADALIELAKILRDSNLNIGEAVETVLRSSLFFHAEQIGTRHASPSSFVVSNLRSLELHGPAGTPGVAPAIAASWMRTLGQDLFQPPGVGGWTGGSSWINAGSMIDRARFALRIADGSLHARAPRCDVAALAKRHGETSSGFAAKLLFGISDSETSTPLPQLLSSTRAQLD